MTQGTLIPFRPRTEAVRSDRRGSGEARRDEIVAVSAELFASSGFVPTSIQDIADAVGLRVGGVYHHFESKDAIALEIVSRYVAELDEVGRRAACRARTLTPEQVHGAMLDLAAAVADVALAPRHLATLQLLLYQQHANKTAMQLGELTERHGKQVKTAFAEIARVGIAGGVFDPRVDRDTFAERLFETVRYVAMDPLYRGSPADEAARLLCHVIVTGLAARPLSDAAADRSAAKRAADDVIATWSDRDAKLSPTVASILDAARSEFAISGYGSATIRTIAARAGVSASNVYRHFRSKAELLCTMISAFSVALTTGYDAVMETSSTSIEKLDALTWLNIKVQDVFDREFQLVRPWPAEHSPFSAVYIPEMKHRERLFIELVHAGLDAGELRIAPGSPAQPMNVIVPWIRQTVWPAQQIVARVGPRATLLHCRSTTLRGASRSCALSR